MKKILIKKCSKSIDNKQREWGMLTIGKEAFNNQKPQKDVPMYSLREGKVVK